MFTSENAQATHLNEAPFRSTELNTRGGLIIDLADPQPSDIVLADIAFHLAGLFRFGGVTRYTVAQHSIEVADRLAAVDRERSTGNLAIKGLLHDAHEAYTGDVTTPLKRALARIDESAAAALKGIQERLQHVIEGRFGLSVTCSERRQVGLIDKQMCAVEAWNFMRRPERWFNCVPKQAAPPEVGWTPDATVWHLNVMSPDEAERTFIERFNRYMTQGGY